VKIAVPRLAGGPPSESYALYAAAGALLLGGPVWHYLYVNHYPPRLEFFLLVGGAAFVGVAIAAAAHRVGGLVESVCFALLLYVFVDLQLDLESHLTQPVLLGIALALSLLLRRRRAAITAITLGAFYLAALPRRAVRAGGHANRGVATAAIAGAKPPVLVHVILDEQWGIGGLRHEGDSATAAFLTDFYAKRGFELYPAAYSRYHHTVESVPAIVSLGRRPDVAMNPDLPDDAGTLRSIPYFATLRARGYRIHVVQSSFLDYCSAPSTPVVSCETQAGNSIANIGHLEGSALMRAELAGRYFLSITSHLYRRLHPDPKVWRRATAGGGLAALRHVRDAIASGATPGNAYFVHVLLPHRPLEVDPACGALKDPTRRVGFENPARLTDAQWSERLALEGDQIRCTHRALGEVLDALDRVADRQHAIVIVHGDHGSRIFQHSPEHVPLSRFDADQLSGYYSTLLAVRRPGVAGVVHPEPVPVQDFVWRLAGQGFAGPVSTDFSHVIYGSHTDAMPQDSVRVLTPAGMPWVTPASNAALATAR
jgi:hypothetical protein